MIKKTLTFILVILIIISFSCEKDRNPNFKFLMTFNNSSKWKVAKTSIYTIYFFNRISKSNLQGELNKNLEFDLTKTETNLIVNREHFENRITGLKPGISFLELYDYNGNINLVSIPYIDKIILKEPYNFKQNNSYQIEFIIDIDKSISTKDSTYTFDWSATSIRIKEK